MTEMATVVRAIQSMGNVPVASGSIRTDPANDPAQAPEPDTQANCTDKSYMPRQAKLSARELARARTSTVTARLAAAIGALDRALEHRDGVGRVAESAPAHPPARVAGPDGEPVPSGTKHDSSKPRTDLLPPDALLEVAKVLSHGAEKYGDNNWLHGMDWGRLYGAALRHLFAYQLRGDLDPESKLRHLAHAACNVLFLLAYQLRDKPTDNRPAL